MRAIVAIVSVSYKDVNPYANKGAKIVNLWHGTPVKRISKPRYSPGYLPFQQERCDLFIVTSDELNREFSDAHNVPLSKVQATGYPRNDPLFRRGMRDEFVEKAKRQFGEDCRMVLYMPTYRDHVRYDEYDVFDTFGFDPQRMSELMGRFNAVFAIKLHHLHKPGEDFVSSLAAFPRVVLADQDDDPTYDPQLLLRDADVLVTDYSSAFVDYLLLDRPILFGLFDHQAYVKERPLRSDFEDVTPGPKSSTWAQLEDDLGQVLQGTDKCVEARAIARGTLHLHQDGLSAQRVVSEISRSLI